ncbi:hypothetical protein Dimus_022831 [Dionaea muscipula]
MELIKRQKWENLFKRRELVHTDAVKEFYAKMTVIHLKKKDIVKSKVRGVEIEFDHEKLATILGIPGTMGSREYVKDVWEESKYIKPLEITVSFTKDHESPYGDWMTMIFEAFSVPLVIKKGEEPKKYDFFEDTFLTMCKLTRENGIWWIGSGENRRRDDDEAAPVGRGSRRSLMRQPLRGNRGRGRSSMMPRKMLKALRNRSMRFQADTTTSLAQAEGQGHSRVDPRVPLAEKPTFRSFKRSLNERGQTNFMMNWRRPKLRMPNF